MRFFEHQEKARAESRRLLLMFALTVLALVLAVNLLLGATWALGWALVSPSITRFSPVFPAYFFLVNSGVTLVFVVGGWWLETSTMQGSGEKLALRAGAREAWPSSRLAEQQLCNIAQELAIASSMPVPKVMVLNRAQGINAFAAGWDEDDAVIAVTQGALDQLTRDELQGLVAHELSHIREGDTQLFMRLSGMVLGLELLHNMGRDMCEPNESGQRTLLAIPGLAVLAAGYLGWLAGRMLRAAVARQREFLADARAVQFTRSKEGLGGVLRKVAGLRAAGDALPERFHPGVHHMLLVGEDPAGHWFDAHPPLEERIRRIYGRRMPPLGKVSEGSTASPEAEFTYR